MNSLAKENPGMAGTTTGAEIDTDIPRNTIVRNIRQAVRHRGARLLVILAVWLVRLEHRRLERNITGGWDAAVSLQLDRLIDVRERLTEYLDEERRRP